MVFTGEITMNKLKKMIINILCEVGKNGVGKSFVWGTYDIKVPIELTKNLNRADDNNSKYKD